MINKREITKAITSLPTLPTVYQNIIRVMSDKHSTIDDIANIISKDQTSSVKILQVANSPLFAASRTISTIKEAVMFLGFIEIRNIVIALSVINLVDKNKKFKNFKPVDFWKHSLAVGIASRLIAKEIDRRILDKVFLAGIIHDIGKLVLLVYFEDEYAKVIDYINEHRVFLVEAENKVLGITHCDVGKTVLTNWKFADYLINSVYYHEIGLVDGEYDPIIASVHLGNIYARTMSFGNPGDELIPKPNENLWDILKLPDDFFSSKADEFKQNYEQIVATIF